MSALRCGQAPPKIHVALVLATAAASVQFASCNRLGAIGGESRRRATRGAVAASQPLTKRGQHWHSDARAVFILIIRSANARRQTSCDSDCVMLALEAKRCAELATRS